MIRKLLQPFYTVYIIIIFVATLFIVLPFYILLSIRNNKKCRKGIWCLTSAWAKVWLWLAGMPLKTYGNMPPKGKYIIIANHVSYLDPVLIFDLIPWYFRPLAKKEISKAPVFGFIYARMAVMVDRSNTLSRAKSTRLIWRTLKQECSIFLYPEGTFNETEQLMAPFHDGAFRLAINTGISILPVLFPDTKQRWHYSKWWKIWPGKNRAFLMDVIPVEGRTMDNLSDFKEMVRAKMGDRLKVIQNA